MEQKVLNKPSMVSRLPKFGSRPANGIPSSLPNGTTQTVPTQEGKNTRMVRASSFSMKWKKVNGGSTDPLSPDEDTPPEEKKEVCSPHSPWNRELKSAASLSTGSPKTMNKSPKSISSLKAKPKNPQIMTTTNSQDTSPKNSGSKPTQNGTLPVGSSTGRRVSSVIQRPRANSGSTRSSSKDSLSQSSDSLLRQPLELDPMVRSQSFTHFKQLPSPTNKPMTRSFSFNKAAELAKPLANTQLRPPRTLGLKSPQSKGRLLLGLGGLGVGKGLLDQLPAERPPSEGLTPSNSIKRPLLRNSLLTKPYRLNRPIAAKPQCPLVAGKTPVESDVLTPPLTPELPQLTTKSASAPTEFAEGPFTEQGLDGNLCYAAEGPEDMSISSASSLEKNDTSEEFLDDFNNLGDQSQNAIPHKKNPGATSMQTPLQSFLSETMNWPGIGLAGGKADLSCRPPCVPPLMSPDVDRHAASSLELSPSNSSGGTYMWDEEGMEPLGNNTHIHRCSSYESDLNSMDILNNLENTVSCDLEDDDLILDVNLPEDGALHSDGMAHCERSERGGRPAQWRRRQQRWSGADHAHNDNRLLGLHYDGCRTGHWPLHHAVQHDSHTVVSLDELTLKHMAEDCSSVKSQLFKLKSLLQMNDGEITPENVESSEDDSRAQQMEELMEEIARLREELKNKDKIITQLTQQHRQESLVRCHCQQKKTGVKGERRTHHDKSTQTVLRPPHHRHAAVATPLHSPWQCQYQSAPRASMPQRRQTSNTSAHQPHPQRDPHPGKTSKNSPHRVL
ncbi:serine-rich coiled-coil domain-containing protein 2-like [Xyrauchen texanus]|uniref:serine-rich coiled-coil domain-containing protein 2-like n=1 Tax=Xyrauchen texanus TaxID=154827 RepID=UPI002241B158|nr:serine-rich coiled-coil domain-containing protein 2-like [Xyrauchen texanus]